MCEICRHSPCDARCPNADPPKVIGWCVQCGEELTADRTYFKDENAEVFCSKDCALAYHGIEEYECYGK